MVNGFNELNFYKSENIIKINRDLNLKIENNLINEKLFENESDIFLKKDDDKIKNLEKGSSNKVEKILITIKKNDTFAKVIDPYFKDNKVKNDIIQELNKAYNLKNLKIGQNIYLFINKENIINKIVIPYDFSTDIIINVLEERVELIKEKSEINEEIKSKKFTIKSSIYEDGIKYNVPLKILSDIIKLYSFDVDFQRDIRVNDQLEFSYEVLYNKERDQESYGELKYASLTLQKSILKYFVFKTDEGYIDYFDLKGKNVKKALMKTPIDGARLSSSYGMRKHPISGYNKLHKGVDFAAPKGTPIYAAGNGIVEFVGRNGGYGKYIRIRHNNSYKTAYAHLNNYKKGLHKGLRVNQGDIIGYVGSTGRSTGPHLHYEIIYNGKQINPMKMKLPPSKTLQNEELKRFNLERKKIYSDFLFNLYE
tara:strand:- start:4062 stop:5330 length:1269 start_codon:yes stop_codon:yes gene_type:complete